MQQVQWKVFVTKEEGGGEGQEGGGACGALCAGEGLGCEGGDMWGAAADAGGEVIFHLTQSVSTLFCRSQFLHKFVNLSFTTTNIKKTLTV